MGIDSDALRTFVAVVDAGSFSRAAQALHLSQPAVSKRIEILERGLGTRVLDRTARRVRLTVEGQLLLQRARPILADIAAITVGLGRDPEALTGILRFGASHHVGVHRLPPILRTFHQRHPGVRLDLRFVDSEGACVAVREGALEFAVATLPAPQRSLELASLWDDPLVVVVAREHALAQLRNASASALEQHPALLPPVGSRTRKLILEALRLRSLQESMTSNHLDTLKALAKAGLGWAVLPRTLLDADLKVIDLAKTTIFRTLGIVRHRHRPLSPAARALVHLLTEP
ncbi:MAG TPA: LysR family transcriptional regulator [Acidiferrobacteraceae bacterium]|nr:LysR family transcriptional regulator [Acidiferrobacteraceae bacterium]